jgi:hypothetical protein
VCYFACDGEALAQSCAHVSYQVWIAGDEEIVDVHSDEAVVILVVEATPRAR